MKTVLVVEDTAAFLKVIEYFMRKQGYQVVIARNGSEALKCLEEHHVDLMITDFQMPVMSAPELLRRVRSTERFADLPVILASAKGYELDIEQLCKEYGLLAVIRKPFSPSHLAQIVNNHVFERCENLPYPSEENGICHD